MKTLYLLRHCEAAIGPVDSERGLTARGIRQAESLGRWMSDHGIVPALIFSSSAQRARLTALTCSERIGYQGSIGFEDDLYDAHIADYLSIMAGLKNEFDSAMIVGHNPEISEAISFFTGSRLNMSPCSLACIELAAEAWDAAGDAPGRLKWVHLPDH